MGNFKCTENEQEKGRWTTNFIPHGGGRYTGQLIVTNQRVVFHAHFDTSLKGVAEELFLIRSEKENFISIPRENIAKIDAKISLLNKRVILNTDNGNKYIIDNGMLPVQKILQALDASE